MLFIFVVDSLRARRFPRIPVLRRAMPHAGSPGPDEGKIAGFVRDGLTKGGAVFRINA
jgi:hypothetical protein